MPPIRTTTAIAALLALTAGTATAQGTSVLTAHDGDASITGEITGVDNGNYLISTMLGDLEIPVDTVDCQGPGCLIPRVAIEWQEGVPGGSARIATHDGSLLLEGTVEALSGDRMKLATQIGEFELPMTVLDCAGPGCPTQVERLAYVEGDGLVAETLANAEAAELVNTALGTSQGRVAQGTEGVQVAAASPAAPADLRIALRMAGPSAVVDTLLPAALGTYAEAFGGRLALSGTPDSVTYGIVTATNEPILGLQGVATDDQQMSLLAEGQIDVAFSVGTASRQDAALIAAAGGGNLNSLDQQRVIAMDGLVAVVGPNHPVEAIAAEDLEAVLSGAITNWSEIGGPDLPIRVLASADNHLTDLLPVPAGTVTADVANTVAQDPSAIGLVPFSASGSARALALTSSCGITTTASPINFKTEQYPLMERVVAYNTSAETSAEMADFLAYLESAEMDEGVRRSNFVDLGIVTEPLAGAREWVRAEAEDYDIEVVIDGARNLVEDMEGKERLSTVFRFDNASTRLDQRSERDLRRVIDFIAAHPDARFTIVGFTDSVGTFDENQDLAQRRADVVLGALRQADTDNRIGSARVGTQGVGELYPLACNDANANRAINRRVEVWMER